MASLADRYLQEIPECSTLHPRISPTNTLPTKKSDQDEGIWFYYSAGGSANSRGDVPWNVAEKRALTPKECIEYFAADRDMYKAENAQLRREHKEAMAAKDLEVERLQAGAPESSESEGGGEEGGGEPRARV